MGHNDFIEILCEGMSLQHFDFNESTLNAYIKALVQSINLSLPEIEVFHKGNKVFYVGGNIYLVFELDNVQFRLLDGTIKDQKNAGRFCMEAIKFVGETSMDFLDDHPELCFVTDDGQIIESSKENVQVKIELEDDEDSDEWL